MARICSVFQQDTTAIAKKNIEVHSNQQLTHTTNHDAYMRVQRQEAYWIGPKAIQLLPAKSTYGKVTWAVRQSGSAGPLVLQVMT